jgi:spermidine synthase
MCIEMTDHRTETSPEGVPASRRVAALLSAVCLCSGFSGLVYQVAWQRLLTIHYGIGAISIALVVSVYMFGLGVGSLIGGRLAERTREPYLVYAGVEGVLGLCGVVSLPLILWLGRISVDYTPAASFAWLFAVLVVSTIPMGITLPVLTTMFAGGSGNFIRRVSHLYFLNTLGAAAGALVTGYVLVSLVGLDGCVYLAAGVNFVLAATILLARRMAQPLREAPPDLPAAEPPHGLGHLAYVLVFVTGVVAIGYEIVWYRVIGVLVKDSPYAFASVLAVYLFGIALGSRFVHQFLERRPGVSRRDAFFTLQFLIGSATLATFAGYYYLTRFTPVQALTRLSFSTDLHPSLALITWRPWPPAAADLFLLVDVFVWPMAFMFVPTVFMGASFPLISSLALTRRGGEGAVVGTTLGFGVLGNVAGGLVTALVLLPAIGTEMTVMCYGVIGLLFGMVPMSANAWRLPALARRAGVLALVILAVVVFPRRGSLYAEMHVPPFTPERVQFEEGRDAVVMTYEAGDRMRNFINGQGHGYRPGEQFLAEAIEALSLAPLPRKVLVVGFGAGSITEAAIGSRQVEKVTVVELCDSVIRNLRKFPGLAATLDDARVRVVIDDGRRVLMRNDERFDLILMDPMRTTTAYANNLHSREFFELAAARLAQGGVLMVGGIGSGTVVPRTLQKVFAHVRAYSEFSVASQRPLTLDHDRRSRLLAAYPDATRARILELVQDSLEGEALDAATAGSPANEDWRPVAEYYLGLQLRQWLARAPLPE